MTSTGSSNSYRHADRERKRGRLVTLARLVLIGASSWESALKSVYSRPTRTPLERLQRASRQTRSPDLPWKHTHCPPPPGLGLREITCHCHCHCHCNHLSGLARINKDKRIFIYSPSFFATFASLWESTIPNPMSFSSKTWAASCKRKKSWRTKCYKQDWTPNMWRKDIIHFVALSSENKIPRLMGASLQCCMVLLGGENEHQSWQ